MSRLNDITEDFVTLYLPKSALVFYEANSKNQEMYVEHFDMDKNGNPTNAHPLTVNEARILAKALQTDKEKSKAFLKPKGILPTNILHLNPSENGSVLWYTKAQQRQMYFVNRLDIPNGKAQIPAMLWFAGRENLSVFALGSDKRPSEKTLLYYAPFLNVYEDGKVCMGTVNIDIKNSTSVEEFMQSWEDYFFNSYFSHLMAGHHPIDGNCVMLWKKLMETGETFPLEVLKKNKKNLKNLLK